MKREFSSKLKELLNSSITPPQNPVQHYQRLAKSPFDDYSRPSLNNTNKSSSVLGLDYSSPLKTVSKVKDDNNNDDNDFFNELTKQCCKYQGKDSNVSTSRNTIMYKHNERNNKNNNNNKYTYEELKQLHQTASKLNKKGANDIHNLNNDSNFIINKKLFHIANTPTSNRRNIVLFGENYKCNGNNNNNKIENRKTRLMSPPPVSLKYDLNKNISNVNQQHRMKYGTFLIHELNPKNKDRKRINKWINEMQDNGKGKNNNNNNNIYMNTEKNDLTNKNIETLLFKKDTKTYKFKGDKRMEAFMKEFDIDSSAFKNITKRHNNI